jgi:Rap1a immunity proteins
MHPMKTGLLAVILLLPAFAAAQSGKDLQAQCSGALKLLNKENVSGDPEDFIKIGNCLGFVNGVMQTAALGKASPITNFCAPADVSVEQVVRMSLNRLQNKPEELDLDAATVVLRALNQGIPPTPCIGGPGRQAEGLRWPAPPSKTQMRVRVVAVALAEPRSSFFSSHEVLIAETEIGDEEWSLIKLVFTYLPYQPRLSESGFDYSVVHELLAWRNTDCDETVAELTARSLPERHEPLIYSRHVPRVDLDRRRIPLPCYEARADDYMKSSLEPIPQLPKPPPRPVLQVRQGSTAKPSQPARHVAPTPTPTPSGPVLKVRPTPE